MRRCIVALATLMLVIVSRGWAAQPSTDRSTVEDYLVGMMEEAHVPGLAAATITPGATERFFLGYADRLRGVPPAETTSFELGSNSKAFTALAVMVLVERGMLDLEAPISVYLPWLTFLHEGEPAEPRVRDFLYHTSGLPFQAIANIRRAEPGNELESTVRTLVSDSLIYPPGEKFTYVTVNYDVLGLLIEVISGRDYRSFVREELLEPMELTHTWMPGDRTPLEFRSTGYKLGFGRPRPFDAPVYPGHTPAAYIHSNLQDMERWVGILLGLVPVGPELRTALHRTLEPNRSVPPDPYYGSLYAGGWFYVEDPEIEFSHPGSNPSFSSCVAFYPQSRRAVIVLANLNSYNVLEACADIHQLWIGGTVTETSDLYRSVDFYCTVLLALCSLGSVLLLILLVRTSLRVRRGHLRFAPGSLLAPRPLLVVVLTVTAVTAALYALPLFLFQQLPWAFVLEWGPTSMLPAVGICWLSLTLVVIRRYLRKASSDPSS